MTLPSLVTAFILATIVTGPCAAQEAIRNRSVRIVGENPAGDVNPPSAPVAPPSPGDATDLANPAGLKIDVYPRAEFSIGQKMTVRIDTQKPGYLIVVDVDSSGRLVQIYPNERSLATVEGSKPKANFLRPGTPRIIPSPLERSNFQFVAAPPTGVNMLLAILSDVPVEFIDLPDVPAEMAGRMPALAYIQDAIQGLRIVPAADNEPIRDPQWSFATQFYVIK